MKILSLNCWGRSVNYHLLDWRKKVILARGTVERVVVGDGSVSHEVTGRGIWQIPVDCPDHASAIEVILRTLTSTDYGVLGDLSEIAAVGHRVAHGGERFTCSVLIDDEVVAAIRSVEHLAPLHNGPNLAGIDATRGLLPNIPQAAIFDTAFHQGMPPKAYVYPLPHEWYEKHGVRRYGFHGASHLFMAKRGAVLLGKPADAVNLVTVHLGKGVSLCAIRNGRSVDTSMGMTPLEGPAMGSRCGDIDAGIFPYIMQAEQLAPKDYTAILNQKSGLAGIAGGTGERREILEGAAAGDPLCRLAQEIEGYRLRKYIGAYFAALGRVDALIFTSNFSDVGWSVREKALAGLEFLGIDLDREQNRQADRDEGETLISRQDSRVPVYAIPVADGLVFAEDVAAILNGGCRDHMASDYSFGHEDFVMPWREREI